MVVSLILMVLEHLKMWVKQKYEIQHMALWLATMSHHSAGLDSLDLANRVNPRDDYDYQPQQDIYAPHDYLDHPASFVQTPFVSRHGLQVRKNTHLKIQT